MPSFSVVVLGKDAEKLDYCLYCDTKYKSNISKHYLSVHADEDKVFEVIATPTKTMRMKKRRTDKNNVWNKMRTVGRHLCYLNRNKKEPLPFVEYLSGKNYK